MEDRIKRCLEIVAEDQLVTSPGCRVPYFPLVVESGKGAIIKDADGNEFIDFLSSAGALNTGHSHPKVVAAIKEQVDKFIHYTPVYFYHEPLVKLSKKLIEVTPGNFPKRVSYGLSGSDGNDGIIKLARAYTGRQKVIAYLRSYHGSTYGSITLSAVSLNMRRKIGPLLPEIYHIPYPDCYRCPFGLEHETCGLHCLEYVKMLFETQIPAEEVAAIVLEPIQGDGGIIVPPDEYWPELKKLCEQYGILFVDEEVQQGFGRTGKWFAIEHWGVEPDAIVLGKAIASGMPMGAIVARKEILEAWGPPAHVFTTAGNPVSCVASLATIDVLREEKLVEHSAELGAYAMNRFREMQEKYELIGDVRGKGLSIGVDLVKDRKTKERAKAETAKVCYQCWKKGLLLSFFSNSVLRVQPPLVITKQEMDQALDIIEDSIKEVVEGKVPDSILETVKGW